MVNKDVYIWQPYIKTKCSFYVLSSVSFCVWFYGARPESSAVDVEAFSQFFAEKVASVRLNTSDSPPASFNHVRPAWRVLTVFLAADDR